MPHQSLFYAVSPIYWLVSAVFFLVSSTFVAHSPLPPWVLPDNMASAGTCRSSLARSDANTAAEAQVQALSSTEAECAAFGQTGRRAGEH